MVIVFKEEERKKFIFVNYFCRKIATIQKSYLHTNGGVTAKYKSVGDHVLCVGVSSKGLQFGVLYEVQGISLTEGSSGLEHTTKS